MPGAGSLLLALALMLDPTASEDQAADEAQALFQEADAAYQTSNYPAAIEAFTKAFNVSRDIQDDALQLRVVEAIQFNLARAHAKAYRTDRDPTHLRVAAELLANYLNGTASGDSRTDAEDLAAEVGDELSRLDRSSAEGRNAEPVTTAQTPEGTPGRGLRIAGYTLVGLSAAGLGMMGAGLAIASSSEDDFRSGPTNADRVAAERRGRTGNALAISGIVTASVVAVAGVVLVAIGTKKRNRKVALIPSPFGRRGFVFDVGGRF